MYPLPISAFQSTGSYLMLFGILLKLASNCYLIKLLVEVVSLPSCHKNVIEVTYNCRNQIT